MRVLKYHDRNSRSSNTRQRILLPALAALAAALPTLATGAEPAAGSADTNAVAKAEKPPPLPLHQIEGNGGVFSTLCAYLVNPPRNGECIGRPSAGFVYVHLGSGRDLEALTVTETPWQRLELGYGYDHLNLGDLPTVLAPAYHIGNSVTMHNANARLQFLREGEFNQKWVPALTAGIHYKYNEDIQDIDRALGGLLSKNRLSNHEGLDFTLYGSKMLTFLPRPLLLNLGGRATKAAQLGLLGFTPEYSFVFEGSAVVMLTDRLLFAAEYKEKPRDFPAIGPVGHEDDWWTIDAGYIVSPHLTVAAGYGHFGTVANHTANGSWGLAVKWEF
jgi:hypothetical protein